MGNKATAIFDADDARFQQAVKRIDRALLGVQSRFAAIGAFGAKMLAAPVAAAAALGAGISQALDVGGHFNDLQANTGVAIADLVVLEQEFRNAGKSGEDVAGVFAEMQKALASGSANAIIRELGIDLEALQKQTPIAQFQAIGKAIAAVENPADRAAASMEIFGKSGASLLSMFSSQGFGEAAAQVGAKAEILARNAALFNDVSVKLALIGPKVSGFFLGVADRVVPVLKPLIDKFATTDWAGIGQSFGDGLALFAQGIADANLGGILADQLKINLLNVANLFVGGILAVVPLLGAALVETAEKFHRTLIGSFLDVVEKIPGTAGYVKERRQALNANTDANDRSSAFFTGLAGKAFNLFDTASIDQRQRDRIDGLMGAARRQQALALSQVPTVPPTGGVPQLDFGNSGPAVSALQRVGGAFGASGGSDPLIEANRLHREGNEWLRNIYDALKPTGRPVLTQEAMYA